MLTGKWNGIDAGDKGNKMSLNIVKVLRGEAYNFWINKILPEYSEKEKNLKSFQDALEKMKMSFGGGIN